MGRFLPEDRYKVEIEAFRPLGPVLCSGFLGNIGIWH